MKYERNDCSNKGKGFDGTAANQSDRRFPSPGIIRSIFPLLIRLPIIRVPSRSALERFVWARVVRLRTTPRFCVGGFGWPFLFRRNVAAASTCGGNAGRSRGYFRESKIVQNWRIQFRPNDVVRLTNSRKSLARRAWKGKRTGRTGQVDGNGIKRDYTSLTQQITVDKSHGPSNKG